MFIYFLLDWAFNAAHGLSLAARSRGYSLGVMCVLLTAVASPISEHGLSGVRSSAVVVHGLSCPAGCGILLGQRSNPCSLYWQLDSQPLDRQGGPRKNFNLCFSKVPLVVLGRMSYTGTGVKIACWIRKLVWWAGLELQQQRRWEAVRLGVIFWG